MKLNMFMFVFSLLSLSGFPFLLWAFCWLQHFMFSIHFVFFLSHKCIVLLYLLVWFHVFFFFVEPIFSPFFSEQIISSALMLLCPPKNSAYFFLLSIFEYLLLRIVLWDHTMVNVWLWPSTNSLHATCKMHFNILKPENTATPLHFMTWLFFLSHKKTPKSPKSCFALPLFQHLSHFFWHRGNAGWWSRGTCLHRASRHKQVQRRSTSDPEMPSRG